MDSWPVIWAQRGLAQAHRTKRMSEYTLGGAWVIVIVPFFINSSESVGFEPNLEASNVIVSLVWLSNVRFSISASVALVKTEGFDKLAITQVKK